MVKCQSTIVIFTIGCYGLHFAYVTSEPTFPHSPTFFHASLRFEPEANPQGETPPSRAIYLRPSTPHIVHPKGESLQWSTATGVLRKRDPLNSPQNKDTMSKTQESAFDGPARIGVYEGEGIGAFYMEVFLTCAGLPYRVFGSAHLVEPGFGDDLGVIILGAGGLSSDESAFGGVTGRKRIGQLVREGRTFVGVCAGAFAALRPVEESMGLGLAPHSLDWPETSDSFQGFLDVEYAGDDPQRFPTWFQNGPVFSRVKGKVLSRFTIAPVKDSHHGASRRGLTPKDLAGRPAVVENPCENGRCLLLAPHFELGSLGVPGYVSLLQAWMKDHFPARLRARPNEVRHGRSRLAFLDYAKGADLFAQESKKPQWAVLRDLLDRSLETFGGK